LCHRTRWIGRPFIHCKLFLKLVGLRGREGDENKQKRKRKTGINGEKRVGMSPPPPLFFFFCVTNDVGYFYECFFYLKY